jgi:hypothetical protein
LGNLSYSEESQIKYSQGDLKRISLPEDNYCKKYIREYTSGFGAIGLIAREKIRGEGNGITGSRGF